MPPPTRPKSATEDAPRLKPATDSHISLPSKPAWEGRFSSKDTRFPSMADHGYLRSCRMPRRRRGGAGWWGWASAFPPPWGRAEDQDEDEEVAHTSRTRSRARDRVMRLHVSVLRAMRKTIGCVSYLAHTSCLLVASFTPSLC